MADARYGPYERNVFDLWKAKTAKPAPLLLFIHGGGFTGGDKTNLPEPLRLTKVSSGRHRGGDHQLPLLDYLSVPGTFRGLGAGTSVHPPARK